MGPEAGRACIFVDGVYKLCLDSSPEINVWIDDPGVDFSWHRLEVRP